MNKSSREVWEKFWDGKGHVEEVYSNSDRIRTNLLAVTPLLGKRILEIGAGTGRDSFSMISDGCSLYLLDYSKNSLRIINSIKPGGKPVYPVGGDAFRLPFADETFDVVFHQGLLEHFKEFEADQLLRENIRVLRPGGYLLVDVPQRYHVYTLIKHILIKLDAWFAGWEREFSLNELCNLLKSLRLEVVASYGEWMYPSLGYRMIREAALRAGLKLPLRPFTIPVLTNIRAAIRKRLDGTALQKNTALSIGVIARKPAFEDTRPG